MKLIHLIENEVPNITEPYEAYEYAKKQGKRIPELEPVIMNNPYWAVYYAKNVIKDRWLEAEPVIMKYPDYANIYIRDFPESSRDLLQKSSPLMLSDVDNSVVIIITDVKGDISKEQFSKLFKLIYPEIKPSQLEDLQYCRHFKSIDKTFNDFDVEEYTIKQFKQIPFDELYYNILGLDDEESDDNDFE